MDKTVIDHMLEAVNRYFINKILTGDFEVVKHNQYKVKIRIDGKRNISFWIANGPDYFNPEFDVDERLETIFLSFADNEERNIAYQTVCNKRK